MKNRIPPFVEVAGRPYLVTSFNLGPPTDLPPPMELLEGLLRHHAPEKILILRPLSRAEARRLRRASEDAAVEAWATIVVREEDRLCPRK